MPLTLTNETEGKNQAQAGEIHGWAVARLLYLQLKKNRRYNFTEK